MVSIPSEAIPSGLVEIDEDDRIVGANEVFLSWIVASVEDIHGRPFDSLVPAAEPTDALTSEYLTGLAEVALADGKKLSVFLKRGDLGSNGRRFVTVFDATQQRRFREQLLRRHGLVERTQRRLELVIESSIAFADATSEARLAEVLAITTAKAYAAEESVVFLLDSDMTFQQVAGTNPFVGVGQLESLTARAVGLRDVVKLSGVDDARALSPAVAEMFERTGVQAMIIAPIHQRDEPLGILAAFFRHPRQFDDQASPLADALAGQAARALTALRLQERLEHAAMHDETTGLPNRRLLEERMDESSRVGSTARGVLFVDLDGFKSVNDQLGHPVGDEVLREVASRLKATVSIGDTVVRYGGDEFVIVREEADEPAMTELAERVRATICAPYLILPENLRLGASIGVALGRDTSALFAIDQLVRAADQAMYRAKYAGGDRIAYAVG